MRQYYVYILSSKSHALYTGVTNDLARRAWQHAHGLCEFTARYRIDRLVYFEIYGRPIDAITREKQIKAWSRSKKVALIEAANPRWRDLADGWYERPTADPSPSLRSGSDDPDVGTPP